jgi:signal transduction histidine kinase
MCEVLEQKVAVKSKIEALQIGEIAGHVRDAISQTRLLSRGLSPIVLESEGLMSGLQELAANTEKIFNVHCALACHPPVLVDDHAAATHLFRIAQEAVSNAIRHGKATRILITLAQSGDRLELKVNDNGTGLPADARNQKGMGLRIMRSRAGTIGGTLKVENSQGKGVGVTCVVALGGSAGQNQIDRGHKTKNFKKQKADSHRR